MASLRGSKSISLQVIADTLRLLLEIDDIEFVRGGIRGIITSCEREATQFKPNKKQP